MVLYLSSTRNITLLVTGVKASKNLIGLSTLSKIRIYEFDSMQLSLGMSFQGLGE